MEGNHRQEGARMSALPQSNLLDRVSEGMRSATKEDLLLLAERIEHTRAQIAFYKKWDAALCQQRRELLDQIERKHANREPPMRLVEDLAQDTPIDQNQIDAAAGDCDLAQARLEQFQKAYVEPAPDAHPPHVDLDDQVEDPERWDGLS
jgi:hypothetical protein